MVVVELDPPVELLAGRRRLERAVALELDDMTRFLRTLEAATGVAAGSAVAEVEERLEERRRRKGAWERLVDRAARPSPLLIPLSVALALLANSTGDAALMFGYSALVILPFLLLTVFYLDARVRRREAPAIPRDYVYLCITGALMIPAVWVVAGIELGLWTGALAGLCVWLLLTSLPTVAVAPRLYAKGAWRLATGLRRRRAHH